ncbi:MAG TPA: hypothetical protein VGR91_20040 [Stellaceae bacterium]|nr:hypothetical protein [Stellaceae bacterium]
MERSSKRGKIPQTDWPSIMARHNAGETLASIARTYDCSPPAISYIVSRSRARNTATEPTAHIAGLPLEPQLIKTHTMSEESRGNSHASDHRLSEMPATAAPPRPVELPRPSAERSESRIDGGNGQALRIVAPAPAAANGERRTLHLSLGQGSHGNGGQEPHSPPIAPATSLGGLVGGARTAPRPAPDFPPGFAPAARQPYAAADRDGPAGLPPGPAAAPQRPQENGAFIDRSLRERVDTDIAAFLAAFDTALDHDTPESRAGLREATDRLLRAGARTRIELERLEARMPLPPHDRPRQDGPAWPQR